MLIHWIVVPRKIEKLEDDNAKTKFNWNAIPFGGNSKDEFEFHKKPMANTEVKVSVPEKSDIKFQSNNYGLESKIPHQQKPDIFIKNIYHEQNEPSKETHASGLRVGMPPNINHQPKQDALMKEEGKRIMNMTPWISSYYLFAIFEYNNDS